MTTEELLKMSPRHGIQKRAVTLETPAPTSGRELTKKRTEYRRIKKRRQDPDSSERFVIQESKV
jgi:hypothetical protein